MYLIVFCLVMGFKNNSFFQNGQNIFQPYLSEQSTWYTLRVLVLVLVPVIPWPPDHKRPEHTHTHTGAVVKRREIKSTTNKQTMAGSGEQNPSASLVKRWFTAGKRRADAGSTQRWTGEVRKDLLLPASAGRGGWLAAGLMVTWEHLSRPGHDTQQWLRRGSLQGTILGKVIYAQISTMKATSEIIPFVGH